MEDCSEKSCCCPCHKEVCHEEGEMSDWFMDVADEAWTEVLKDKIKDHILKNNDKRMNELAKIVSEANNERWKAKLNKKHSCAEFKMKLAHFFGKK